MYLLIPKHGEARNHFRSRSRYRAGGQKTPPRGQKKRAKVWLIYVVVAVAVAVLIYDMIIVRFHCISFIMPVSSEGAAKLS